MSDVYKKLKAILPTESVQVAKVLEHEANGVTSRVEFPGGSQTVVRGQGVDVGNMAFIRGGAIEGPAPNTVPLVLDV